MTRAERRKIAILIVAYRGESYLRACIDSLLVSCVEQFDVTIYVLENGCPTRCCRNLDELYPSVQLLSSSENLGFAGGNNFGWEQIKSTGIAYDYLLLLNQDTTVTPLAVETAAGYLDRCTKAGAVQSLLLLDPEADLINTAGNQSHFLGFGFLTRYRERYVTGAIPAGEIGYASGAAVMLRCELLDQVGLFEDFMFMYLEDADLSWKLRSVGRPPHLCADSLVHHQYQFNRSFTYLRHLEQNRWCLMLAYYQWRTLIIIFPAAILMELGQVYFAARNGRLIDKLKAMMFLVSPTGIKAIVRHRTTIQARRKVSDAELTRLMVGEIFTPQLDGFLVNRIASPLFSSYWKIVRRLIS